MTDESAVPHGEEEGWTTVTRAFGEVPSGWESLYRLDKDFATTFADYVAAAVSGGGVLEPRIRELLLLAHAASVTVQDRGEVARRVRSARAAGASEREVLDVIQALALISIHSVTTGLPLLFDPADYPPPEETSGPYWEDFERRAPGFNGMFKTWLPDLFDAYRALGRLIWRPGGLEPKWRELVLVVADMSTSHLYSRGAVLHIDAARRHGATDGEIAAAIGLAVPWVARTVEMGAKALEDYRREPGVE